MRTNLAALCGLAPIGILFLSSARGAAVKNGLLFITSEDLVGK